MMPSTASQCLNCKYLFKGRRGLKIHHALKNECLDAYLRIQKHVSRKPTTSKKLQRKTKTKIKANKKENLNKEKDSSDSQSLGVVFISQPRWHPGHHWIMTVKMLAMNHNKMPIQKPIEKSIFCNASQFELVVKIRPKSTQRVNK